MPDFPPSRSGGATIFERHAEVWRLLAIILPAAFAGSLAGDIAEQHGIVGPRRLGIVIAVGVVLTLLFLPIWNRVVAWLAGRRGSRPTVERGAEADGRLLWSRGRCAPAL